MTDTTRNQMSLDEFAELVDTFGSDRTRWPLLRRHRAEALLAGDGAARRLLDEATAFDKVLDAAGPPAAADTGALLEAIMARATAGPRLATSTEAPRTSVVDLPRANAALPRRSADRRDVWRAGALMAASLCAGLYLGQAQWSASTVPLMEEIAASTFGGNTQRLAFAAFTTDDLDDE